MSENQQHIETRTMLTDKSQGSVRGGGIFDYQFITAEFPMKDVLISVNNWQGYKQESWLSQVSCALGHHPAERRTVPTSDTRCNRITLW